MHISVFSLICFWFVVVGAQDENIFICIHTKGKKKYTQHTNCELGLSHWCMCVLLSMVCVHTCTHKWQIVLTMRVTRAHTFTWTPHHLCLVQFSGSAHKRTSYRHSRTHKHTQKYIYPHTLMLSVTRMYTTAATAHSSHRFEYTCIYILLKLIWKKTAYRWSIKHFYFPSLLRLFTASLYSIVMSFAYIHAHTHMPHGTRSQPYTPNIYIVIERMLVFKTVLFKCKGIHIHRHTSAISVCWRFGLSLLLLPVYAYRTMWF